MRIKYNLTPGEKLTVVEDLMEEPRKRRCTVVKEYRLFVVVDYGLYRGTIDKRKCECLEMKFWKGWSEE